MTFMNDEEQEIKKETTREGLKRYFAAGITLFLVIAAASILFLMFSRLSNVVKGIRAILHILEPIVFGFIIAYLIAPSVRFFERKLDPYFKKIIKSKTKAENLSKTLGIVLGIAVWVILIVILMIMVIPELVENISNLVNTLPGQIEKGADTAIGILKDMGLDSEDFTMVVNTLETRLTNWLEKDMMGNMNVLFGRVTVSMVSFFRSAFNIVIGIVVAIYVLDSRRTFKRQLKQIIYAFLPERTAQVVIENLHESNNIFTGFISGKMVDSVIIGVICFFGLSLLRMPYTLLISVIIGVTNIIPFFGPYLGAIPCGLLILLNSPLKALIFAIFILVLQQLDGNVIGPKILGQSTGLSAFWVVFAILLFGGLFGVIGMLFGVPVFAVIYRIIANVVDHSLRKKGLVELAEATEKEKK